MNTNMNRKIMDFELCFTQVTYKLVGLFETMMEYDFFATLMSHAIHFSRDKFILTTYNLQV